MEYLQREYERGRIGYNDWQRDTLAAKDREQDLKKQRKAWLDRNARTIRFTHPDLKAGLERHEITQTLRSQTEVARHGWQPGVTVRIVWYDGHDHDLGAAVIESVDTVHDRDLTDEDAQRGGMRDRDHLVRVLSNWYTVPRAKPFYRVRFKWTGTRPTTLFGMGDEGFAKEVNDEAPEGPRPPGTARAREGTTGYPEFDEAWDDFEAAFPDAKIVMTAGPYRSWDVDVDTKEDGSYAVDFYSALRRGFGSLSNAVNFAKTTIAVNEIHRGHLKEEDLSTVTNMVTVRIGACEELESLWWKTQTRLDAMGLRSSSGIISVKNGPCYIVAVKEREAQVREVMEEFLR